MRVAATVLIALAGTAAAQPAPGAFPFRAAPPPPAHDSLTLSFSPAHLAFPMVEVAGEVRVASKLAVAIILGAGRYGDWSGGARASTYEGGGQLNYYIQHAFDGLHAGAEITYLKVTDLDPSIMVGGTSAALGVYVGFKAVASFGLTFVAQGGVGFSAYRARNTDALSTQNRAFPLLNLNLGWSF